jgi:hypothetical protein
MDSDCTSVSFAERPLYGGKDGVACQIRPHFFQAPSRLSAERDSSGHRLRNVARRTQDGTRVRFRTRTGHAPPEKTKGQQALTG